MDISPNPYRTNTALAEEHTDVLLAAATTDTSIADMLTWLFVHFRATEGAPALPNLWWHWEAEMRVEQWNWKRSYQQRIFRSHTDRCGRTTLNVVDTVDACVVARRRFSLTTRGTQHQVEWLCFFADAGLSSVTTLQRRICAIESVHPNACCIVVTRRAGIALQPLLSMDRVVVFSPAEPSSPLEELPEHWHATAGDTHASGILDEHGFRFPSSSAYPALSEAEFAKATERAGGELLWNDELPSEYSWGNELPRGLEALL